MIFLSSYENAVIYYNAERENMLFSKEVKGIMLIDFERAQSVELCRPPLAQLMLNKRRRTGKALKGSDLWRILGMLDNHAVTVPL
ncbi:hypothetical protein CCUS01_15524 [Colletotrichum cuscutae]|uniref:Uncharacterized protein n=1 Tax=Colletotrichum cuscutae TaxID=1209917 RepID=A0AAI9Y5Q2_9PEZI|nr:hypothetical protein CCUS01_15524 [Colletotrichum cuscutae]